MKISLKPITKYKRKSSGKQRSPCKKSGNSNSKTRSKLSRVKDNYSKEPWNLKKIESLPEVINVKAKMQFRVEMKAWLWRMRKTLKTKRKVQKNRVQENKLKTKMTMTVTFD